MCKRPWLRSEPGLLAQASSGRENAARPLAGGVRGVVGGA